MNHLLSTYVHDVSSPALSSSDSDAAPPASPLVPSAPPVNDDDESTARVVALPAIPTPLLPPALTTHVDTAAFDRQYHRFTTTGSVVDPAAPEFGGPRILTANRPRKRPRFAAATSSTLLVSSRTSTPATGSIYIPPSTAQVGKVMLPSSELLLAPSRGTRHWLAPPAGARVFADLEEYTAYVPKRIVHSYESVNGGVAAVRFLPGTGHLLAGAGMDGVVRLWEVEGVRRCVRTYSGHGKGVKDVCFANDGRSFLSAGYDAAIRLWDTETGKVVASFAGNKSIPFCVKFHPDDGRQTEFLAGCADRKVIQLDTRDGNSIVQSYDQHMGAVNAITFIDDNRRFVSSADDKVLRVWEYGIPVVIKYVSDPTMHSMPVMTPHPNGKSMACQSMDNCIAAYSVLDKFKLNRKKKLNNHLTAGYACGLSFSPDGRFIASGDSMGRVYFYDWKTSRMMRALKVHSGVTIDVAWHPTSPSRVATCSWDGGVKLLD
jgi:WD40 repeat protein